MMKFRKLLPVWPENLSALHGSGILVSFAGAVAAGISMYSSYTGGDQRKFAYSLVAGTLCVGINKFLVDKYWNEFNRRRTEEKINSLYGDSHAR